tara:strand:+ start:70 stop:477 length:408 start_codon:yes stop_codon:yes gene_type:complete
MQLKKNIRLGKNRFYFVLLFFFFTLKFNYSISEENVVGKNVEIKILDKVNSKNSTLNIQIGKEKKFENLLIKALMCSNSKFDDNPEITAYLQVKDLTVKDKDKVFVFNGWTFSSSPSLKPFDHPIYDIWLTKCFN